MVPTLVLKYTTYTASKRTKVMKSLRSFIGECRRYEMNWNDMNSKGNSESLKGLLLVWTRLYIYYTTQTWMVAYGSSVPDFTMARWCSVVRCKLRCMLNFTRNHGISPNWLKDVEGFNMFQLFQPDFLSHQGFNMWVHIAESLANVALLFQERLRFGQGISQVLGRSSAQVHDVCVCVIKDARTYMIIYDHMNHM